MRLFSLWNRCIELPRKIFTLPFCLSELIKFDIYTRVPNALTQYTPHKQTSNGHNY